MKIRVTFTVETKDEYVIETLLELKDKIQSGEFQRDMDKEGLTKTKILFEFIER